MSLDLLSISFYLWQLEHNTIGFFELATKTNDQTLVLMLQCFKHDKYGLKIKMFAYIKNEGANLDATDHTFEDCCEF
jgi:hypothetical protein